MKVKLTSYIGWYGVFAILAAYILLSFNIIASRNLPYQLLNLSGALSIVYESLSKKDRQPAVLNAVWALVAVAALLRLILK